MGGGLMQLVAYGAQDVFLTGKPEISFFKVVYRRHTNFATESIMQTLNGTVQLGNRVSATISRNGDLVTNMYLEVDISSSAEVDYALGHALIEYVELEIGGQRIDKQYGEWLEILSELTVPEDKQAAYNRMVCKSATSNANGDDATTNNGVTPFIKSTGASAQKRLYIPLQFFFCRNPGLALPLIALQYHEVKVTLKLRAASELKLVAANELVSVNLWVDYVYLDTTERRRFAQMQHEYLIEQLQHTGPAKGSDNTQRLNFNHPVKELIWVFRDTDYDKAHLMNFAHESPLLNESATESSEEWFGKMKLLLNGHDRFAEREASYFRYVQPYQHHTRVPWKQPIYCYSFALNPESHQPSGTCNFSRLDNVQMKFTPSEEFSAKSRDGDDQLLVYAVNYNVLRIMSGMGGLAYSN
tara:strand:- start:3123 stop:4361 length:1239 start_codon:yes stop_codon:yes gene_type:complete